jgi:hypothetical protein
LGRSLGGRFFGGHNRPVRSIAWPAKSNSWSRLVNNRDGIEVRLINTGLGVPLQLVRDRVDGRARLEVDPHGRLQCVGIATGALRRSTRDRPQAAGAPSS